MQERLSIFLKEEELTSGRLAEIINVQPSAISHILSGRNKPGFDFISKLFHRFPKLNPKWIILGEEPMYLLEENDRIDNYDENLIDMTGDLFEPNGPAQFRRSDKPESHPNLTQSPGPKTPTGALPEDYYNHNNSGIERIIIFFKDGGYKEYK